MDKRTMSWTAMTCSYTVYVIHIHDSSGHILNHKVRFPVDILYQAPLIFNGSTKRFPGLCLSIHSMQDVSCVQSKLANPGVYAIHYPQLDYALG